MRLESLHLRGFGPFKTDVNLDLTRVQGPIVAVAGANGAGKSTLLELWGAASLYRAMPTRGTLASMATARDSILEATVVNGKRLSVRHTVDSRSGKGESVAIGEDGGALTSSGKVRDFDAWASLNLPTPEVLYSTVFTPQGAAGFIGLREGDRKAVLLRVLGVERLERLAEQARVREREARAALATLDARIADERARGVAPVTAEMAKADAEREAKGADAALLEAKGYLSGVMAAAASAEEAQREAKAASLKRSELVQRLEQARLEQAQIEERIKNNEGLVARAGEIRAAVERITQIDGEMVTRESERKDAAVTAATATAAAARAQTDQAAAMNRRQAAGRRRDNAVGAAALRAEVASATEKLRGARDESTLAGRTLADAEAAREALQGQRAAGADQRISDLRTGLELVRDHCQAPDRVAGSALDLDDGRILLARELPGKLADAAAALAAAARGLQAAQERVRQLEATAARGPEVERLEADHAAALADLAEAEASTESAGVLIAEQRALAEASRAKAEAASAALVVLISEREKLQPAARLAERLAQAQARIDELSPQAADRSADVAMLERDIGALPEPAEPPLAPSTAAAEQVVLTAERQAREAAASLAVAAKAVEQAWAREGRLGEFMVARADVVAELEDWVRLATDLGRDGIQALEIDSAGPELTAMVNDLLWTCVGSRWTVTIETTRTSADGKKQIEGCAVRVLDSQEGREGDAETFSGGERVLIGEAVSLALTMLACRRAGIVGATLVRDESGAALDPENARGYLSMLRRAAELVQADKVLFVSHNRECQEMADSRITVADGGVEVS